MKTLHRNLVPLVLAAFLTATVEWTCQAQYPETYSAFVQRSDNLTDWTTIAGIDLSTAVLNPYTGNREIHITIEVDETETGARMFHAYATGELPPPTIASYTVCSNSVPAAGLTTPIKCNGAVIIAVLVLVVAGIVIYVLIKTCKKLLGPKE